MIFRDGLLRSLSKGGRIMTGQAAFRHFYLTTLRFAGVIAPYHSISQPEMRELLARLRAGDEAAPSPLMAMADIKSLTPQRARYFTMMRFTGRRCRFSSARSAIIDI